MKKFIAISLIISFLLSSAITALIMFPAIDHNAQGEYCEDIGHIVSYPSDEDRTFVKTGWNTYELYDPKIHKNYNKFYVRSHDVKLDFSEADWSSQGSPCKLNDLAHDELNSTFIFFFKWLIIISIVIGFIDFIVIKRGKNDR